MKQALIIASILLITSCTGTVPNGNELKGNWINETVKVWAEFNFLDDNVCDFASGSKISNAGVKIPCKYLITDENIEIYQTDQNLNSGKKIFILEYDTFSNSLLLRKSENDYKPIIFKKK
jgi:hypothetical protein